MKKPMVLSRQAGLVLAGVVLASALVACGGGSSNDEGFAPGDVFAVTESGRLVSFAAASPQVFSSNQLVSGLAAGDQVVGIDFRPSNGLLHALTLNGTTGRIYTISIDTGMATLVSTLVADPADLSSPYTGLSGANFGVDFNPVPDRLRVVSNTGQNLRINAVTGATITDTTLNGSTASVTGAAYTNNFAAACRTSLFYIDGSDNLATTTDPNAGVTTTVGALNVPGAALNGFEIGTSSAGTNVGIAALTTGQGTALYGVSLATGTASIIGSIGTGADSLRGLATRPVATAPAQAAGELYGVTESNQLISFNRAAPSKTCTEASIAPLNVGENVIGIDFRPSTGALHALTDDSRLLVVDPATGATSSAIVLSVPLAGTAFGMDFNPTGPVALRIVSDTGQNLRVTDFATGTTSMDADLNGDATRASAAAYTNSVSGAVTTALFVVDEASDALYTQSPPNDGVLALVGALSVDIGEVNGFDIDGNTGTALMAVSLALETSSQLRTLDLATGTASASLGTIGGGERIRGLTRSP